ARHVLGQAQFDLVVVAAGRVLHADHHAHGYAPREQVIAAACLHGVAHGHTGVLGHIDHGGGGGIVGVPVQQSEMAGAPQLHAGLDVGVEHADHRGEMRAYVAYHAHDAVGTDHAHIVA